MSPDSRCCARVCHIDPCQSLVVYFENGVCIHIGSQPTNLVYDASGKAVRVRLHATIQEIRQNGTSWTRRTLSVTPLESRTGKIC